MAADRVEVVISAKDEFSRNFGLFAVKAGAIAGVVSAGLTKAFELSGDALRGLVSITGQAIKAANEQEDAEKRLTVALGYRSTALINQASALQKVTIYEDNQIIQAQATIAMYIKDEAQIKAVTKATLDMATAKGIDLHSASQLVARTLGSETNALARQGIEVKGAVGSTERLNSLISELSTRFSGQAAAAAETFSGKTAQAKNALGELYETIGGVITRNTFFIKGLDLVKQYLERAATWVDNNRLMLMNLTKDGIVNLMVGISKAIEVMRFFHNRWLGLKIIGNAVAIVFADSLRIIFEGLRMILHPLDLIYRGMVKLGVIASNPFDKASEAIGQFQLSSRDVMADVLRDTEEVNHRYDEAGYLIDGMTAKLRALKVEQAILPATAQPGMDAGVDPLMERFNRDVALRQEMQFAMNAIDKTEAENRLKLERQVNAQTLQIKMTTFNQLAGMLRAFSGDSKLAAIAAIAIEKAAGIASVFISTEQAAMAALVPPPIGLGPLAGAGYAATIRGWGAASMALIAAQGLGEMGQASGAFGGGGGGVSPGSPGGQPIQTELIPPGTVANPPQQITVIVHTLDPSSVNWDRITEQEIVPALNRGGDRNIQLQHNVVGAS